MEFRMFHTINSGLLLSLGGASVLVDALHGKAEGFSRIPDPAYHEIMEGQAPLGNADGLLFTHTHPDHYDDDLVSRYRRRRGPIPVILPEDPETAAKPAASSSGIRRFDIKGIDITAMDTVHDGELYRDVAHQSFLLRGGAECIFLPGDALLPEADCNRVLALGKPTLGCFNVYQLARKPVWELVKQSGMERVFLYHLGLEEDDAFGYIKMAKSIVGNFPSDLPAPVILAPMSQVSR